MSDTDARIVLSEIEVTFRRKERATRLFRGATYEFKGEKYYSILGPNGCGKSTLLRVLLGLQRPSSGEVIRSDGDLCRVGYVPQNYKASLLPWFSAYRNLTLPLAIRGLNGAQQRTASRQLLDSLGVSIDLSRYPYQLSGGQQQLLCVARALISKPRVLVLDEPFSALDVRNRPQIRDAVVRESRTRETLLLFVSHQIRESIIVADEILVLDSWGQPVKGFDVEAVDRTGDRPHVSRWLTTLEGEVESLIAQL